MDRLPYSAAPSGERTTIVWGMASTIPRASCSDNDAVAVKVLISLFSVPAGWTRVLDIRGGTVTGHSAGFRSAPRASPAAAVAWMKKAGNGGRRARPAGDEDLRGPLAAARRRHAAPDLNLVHAEVHA